MDAIEGSLCVTKKDRKLDVIVEFANHPGATGDAI